MLEPALLQIPDLGPTVLRWPVLAGAGALLVLFLGFQARRDIADAMGLTTGDVALLTVGSIAAPVLNVPLWVIGEAVVAVNLGGALVPLLVTLRLRRAGRLDGLRLALVTILVAAATWAIVEVDPSAGVVAPFPQFLIPGTLALVAALAVARGRLVQAGPLAYAGGTLGALVGADLLSLGPLLEVADQALPGTALVLGGAGAFDLIFLSGAIGLALSLSAALVLTDPPARPVADPSAAPKRVPEPERVLRTLDRLQGLTPRERCLAHIARANRALADRDPSEAVREAHGAVDALLRSGSPPLLERVADEGPEAVRVWMRELTSARQRSTREAPAWHEAGDAVETAKHLSGALWQSAPGRVRVDGGVR